MCGEGEVFELIGVRTRIELLEQNLSQAAHLVYCLLVSVAESPASEFRDHIIAAIKAKILQMAQGSAIGRALMELDAQFGRALETHGVRLERWVFEPREKQ